MSGPDWEDMVIQVRSDRTIELTAPWVQRTAIDDNFLGVAQRHGMRVLGDGMVQMTVGNGWATYRFLRDEPERQRTIWELVESEWTAPTPAAEREGERGE